ncbi:MAG: hypothetical protein HY815_03025 [Candidatus Riflebacteria bacterium]|nr:hypothetical protein [Candidatus Riflebacteria bacterium]
MRKRAAMFQRLTAKLYMRFAILNTLLVWPVIFFMIAHDVKRTSAPHRQELFTFYGTLLIVSAAVVLAQYPLINGTRRWLVRILYFYLSMVAFLSIVGLIFSWNAAVGSSPAGSWAARLDGTVRMVFFGHFLGLPAFPFIDLANWMLRSILFYESPSKGDAEG